MRRDINEPRGLPELPDLPGRRRLTSLERRIQRRIRRWFLHEPDETLPTETAWIVPIRNDDGDIILTVRHPNLEPNIVRGPLWPGE